MCFSKALPVLHQSLDKEEILNDRLLNKGLTQALLAIISENDDSNILYRKGEEVLQELKDKASTCLLKSKNKEFESVYNDLIAFCKEKRISPGGSADLLAVSYFMYSVNRQLVSND